MAFGWMDIEIKRTYTAWHTSVYSDRTRKEENKELFGTMLIEKVTCAELILLIGIVCLNWSDLAYQRAELALSSF